MAGLTKDSGNQPTGESFMLMLSLSLRDDPPSCNKEESIAINRDGVYNQAYMLSQDIHVISLLFVTFDYFMNR